MALSPNFGPRRGGERPELIVLHYTAMPDCASARDRLCDPAAEVSVHWLISASGAVEALVPEEMRAWHAGAGSWQGRGDINSRSIGIELDNPGDRPFPEPQMRALETLMRGIMARWRIGPEAVIGHSDMAPERKIDPGPRFDWRRLADEGLSIWPESGGTAAGAGVLAPDMGCFVALARAFGYPEAASDCLLRVFRLRFRPWAEGPLAGADMAAMADLALRFGADGGAWRTE